MHNSQKLRSGGLRELLMPSSIGSIVLRHSSVWYALRKFYINYLDYILHLFVNLRKKKDVNFNLEQFAAFN